MLDWEIPVGFIGYGHIAKAIAKRAAAFDMKLMAVRRNTDHKPEELAWLASAEQLPELLGKSDFVVIACDLNDSTQGLFNTATIAQMKSGQEPQNKVFVGTAELPDN